LIAETENLTLVNTDNTDQAKDKTRNARSAAESPRRHRFAKMEADGEANQAG
jgi:hypothetical protein